MLHLLARPLAEILPNALKPLVGSQQLLNIIRHGSTHQKDPLNGQQWQWMVSQGHVINPCNSKLHPAALVAGIQPDGRELSVQEAYTPNSSCFGCGPVNPDGIQIKSMRIKNGLQARISLPKKFCAFPGIVNGGVVGTIMDCHGNWTAAIALMDRSCLPKPPLTLTASMLVTYKEPTPPDMPLRVRSNVVSITEGTQPGMGKATVEVDIHVYLVSEKGEDKLLVTGTGIFKRMGALRVM